MSSKYAVSVSLTEHLCEFVAEQVASGRYRTASEVVRQALRLLETQFSDPQPSNGDVAKSTDTGSGPVTPHGAAQLRRSGS
ncbi:type II toxin-antitoxin system ParD family antitoxin [Paraburkholderia sprentiae WSM5005]|uniref:Type II toxin-antitoxin system ParD family antitoxin n=1 Tax=Paraburkholderia sprentiae WSM5005 TaxID=754502 RepID=A0A1I9YM36_9BURK|nr:type II toxin-antitoxin system ParD family antitoxin [Paraburkholderia sprentiae WSM5005]